MTSLLRWPPVGRRALRVWQRNWIVWRKFYKSSLVGNLGEPILFLVALGLGLGQFIPSIGGISYMQFIAPGLLVYAAMNSASFECTFGSFTRLETQRTYDAIIATPVSVEEVVAGDILWGTTKALASGLSILVVLLAFGLIASPWALLAPALVLLEGLLFASLAMTWTSLSPSYDFFSYYFTLFIAPMFLFSGIFFPLESLPAWVGSVAGFLPLVHAVNLSRACVLGQAPPTLWGDLAYLATIALVAFIVAVNLLRRRLVK